MTLTAANLAKAAESLVGTPFRLHGRDPASGLDCIGVLAAALARCGARCDLPGGYRLRMASLEGWLPDPADFGFAPADGPALPGDVVMQQLGAAHVHLAIAARADLWVHAHAGLRRVVASPALPEAPVIHHWRVRNAI